MSYLSRIVIWLGFFLIVSCAEDGIDGLSSLIKVSNEGPGVNCSLGGTRIDSGIDKNRSGVLDQGEIQSTVYVCNGSAGQNSLIKVTTEPVGANCANGGHKIETGLDSNNNQTLDNAEIQQVAYVCNGTNGMNSLIKITREPEGTNCENGGYKIDAGLDNNRNGILDSNEITSTEFICDEHISELEIGMSYQGGIIFYLDATQEHGLIASTTDLTATEWGAHVLTSANGVGVGTGMSNTDLIVAALGAGNYAAASCYQLTMNGYDDWFLPSIFELNLLYLKRGKVGGFTNENYWSSSETSVDTAWGMNFSDGSLNESWAKSGNLFLVRPIRSF